jgi:hypothetical protein
VQAAAAVGVGAETVAEAAVEIGGHPCAAEDASAAALSRWIVLDSAAAGVATATDVWGPRLQPGSFKKESKSDERDPQHWKDTKE